MGYIICTTLKHHSNIIYRQARPHPTKLRPTPVTSTRTPRVQALALQTTTTVASNKAATTSKDILSSSKDTAVIPNSNRGVTMASRVLCNILNKDIRLSNTRLAVTRVGVDPAQVESVPVLWLLSHAAAAWTFSSRENATSTSTSTSNSGTQFYIDRMLSQHNTFAPTN